MKTFINFRLTSLAVAIITLITIPTAIAGSDSVISGAIIQAGWCGQGNYICLIRIYIAVSISIIVLCFLLDLGINKWFINKEQRKKEYGNKKKQNSTAISVIIEILSSPRTNDNRVILTIQKKSKYLVHSCHAKITRIRYKPFQKLEYEDIQTTNKKLKWDSVDSEDGLITLRNKEDLELAWAKDVKSFDENRFGFSYIIEEPQSLSEGYYLIDVTIFGEWQNETTEVTKTFLLSFHSIVDMRAMFRGHNYRKKSIVVFHEDMVEKLTPDQFDTRFTIQMSKTQFERELGSFVSASEDSSALERPIFLLSKWATLRRKRTTAEIALSQGGGVYEDVQNVDEADIIKLIKEPYGGLVLELSETPAGLWISIIPEGYTETIDTISTKNGDGWESVRTRRIHVDEKAHVNLLKWLQSLHNAKEP